MTILKILQYPDLRLGTKSQPVVDVGSPRIQKIIGDITETLVNQDSCAGLAATQLDIEDPPSISIINNPENSEIMYLINPKIIESSGDAFMEEACMSVYPGHIHAKVKRATKIKVSMLDMKGNEIIFDAKGDLAHVIQHECDHLNGMLYLDRLSEAERERIDKKVGKKTK